MCMTAEVFCCKNQHQHIDGDFDINCGCTEYFPVSFVLGKNLKNANKWRR